MVIVKIVRIIDMVRLNGMFLVVELGSELMKMIEGLSVMQIVESIVSWIQKKVGQLR